MCGHVGAAGKLNGTHERALKTLLILDSLRGEHSTGVAFVPRNGDVLLAKQVGNPFELFEDKRYEAGGRQLNRVLIGHNRYATQGAVNKRNAHPFEFETIVGAHNGTLTSKWKLKDHATFPVDSQALFYHIEQNGLEDAIAQLGGPNNAWALVWWNKVEETLNFLRNKERPLFMCRSDDKEAIFWASEAWMLDVALNRSAIPHGDIVIMEVDMHYSFPIHKDGTIVKPTVKKVVAPEPVYPIYTNNNWKQQNNNVTQTNTQVATKKDTAAVKVGGTEPKKAVTLTVVGVPKPDSSYLSSKGLVFEILQLNRDTHGQEYLALFDLINQDKEVRLYLNGGKLLKYKRAEWMSREIIADVASFNTANGSFHGYYKVSPWTVKEVDDIEIPDVYPDAKGTMMSREDWVKRYPYCTYCTGNIDPDEEFKFSSEGDCFCQDCTHKESVKSFVKFK